MSTEARTPNQGTDPRPSYFALGVDETGAHHCYCTATDTAIVVDDGAVERVQDLAGTTIDGWMEFVAARRGWASRRYGRSLADLLVDGFREDGE